MAMADGFFPWDFFHVNEEDDREGISVFDMPYNNICDNGTMANSHHPLFLSSTSYNQGPVEFSCHATGGAAYSNYCMSKKRRMLFTSTMNHEDLYGDHRVFSQLAINSHDPLWIGSHDDLFDNNVQGEKRVAYIEPTHGTLTTPTPTPGLEEIKLNNLEISPLNNNRNLDNLDGGWLYSRGGWLSEEQNNEASFLAPGAFHQNPFGHPQVSISKEEEEEEEEESHNKVSRSKLVSGKKTLVYPFALLKPCEIQGDKTLKDINQKIHQTQSRRGGGGGGGDKPLVVLRPNRVNCIAGEKIRSVVARTTIYTHGQGSITVVRTKGG